MLNTYIADRSYGSFKLLMKVIEAGASGIFRVKNNLLDEVGQALELTADDRPVQDVRLAGAKQDLRITRPLR